MTGQAGKPPDVLEERVRRLEDQVAILTEAVRVLVRGMEDLPGAEPSGDQPGKAARHAHELLLTSGVALKRAS